MKRQAIRQLSTQSTTQLQAMGVKLEQELMELRMELKIKKQKNLRSYKLKRHDLARVKTVIREKELNIQ